MRQDEEQARPEMSEKVYRWKRRIMLTFSIPLVTFLLYRMYVLAPHLLYGFFIWVPGITIALIVGYLFVRRVVTRKCVQCGGVMEGMGVAKVSAGAIEKGTEHRFGSLGKHVFRCEDCGNEYHELVYYQSATGDAADYEKDMKASEVYLNIMGREIPGEQTTINANELTHEEYRNLKRKFADEVIAHNMRNGFGGNPIKIDLEE